MCTISMMGNNKLSNTKLYGEKHVDWGIERNPMEYSASKIRVPYNPSKSVVK